MTSEFSFPLDGESSSSSPLKGEGIGTYGDRGAE